jgi:formate C-acetyltransferase
MEFIIDRDYEYIKSKYNPFIPNYDKDENGALINSLGLNRFSRVDSLFDGDSGLDGDLIKKMIRENDEKIKHLSHPVRKALALKLVLENTRIRCDSRDIFPAINCIDRPIDATLINAWKSEVFRDLIPDVNKRRVHFCDSGIATIWPDYCHSINNFDRLFALGFGGILEESEKARSASPNTPEEEEFFEGIKITYEAVIAFLLRLAETAEKTPGSEKMAKALNNLARSAPESFYEACLSSYFYFMISEHVDGLQVRSLSNFDRVFYPYWKRDLERGKAKEELRRELAYYLMQFAAIDNYWGQPVYLGGTKEDGSTEINELSYIFLDTYDKMGIFNPKIQLKVSLKNTPKDFMLKALDMIRRGNNSIVFVSDDTITKAMMHCGMTYEEARNANISGCYEFSPVETFGCGMNYVNLLKPMEYALHCGHDGVSGKKSGLDCKAASEYESFDEFFAEYKRQLGYIVDEVIDIVNGFEDYLYVIDPLSLLSGTFRSCIEKKKDAIGGGSLYNISTIMFGFLADMADSLTMIKKYVFDKKALTLGELTKILDANYAGNENLRMKLLLDPEKYGNNKTVPDTFATEIVAFLMDHVYGRKNCKVRG